MLYLVTLAAYLTSTLALLYVASSRGFGRFKPWHVWLAFSGGLVILSTLSLPAMVRSVHQWRDGAQAVLTGARSKAQSPLVIGGEDGLLLWPDGARYPRLEAQAEEGGLRVKVGEGGGFLRVEEGVALNGIQLPTDGAPVSFEKSTGLSLEVKPTWKLTKGRVHSVRVTGLGVPVEVTHRFRPTMDFWPFSTRDRFFRLERILQPEVIRLRAEGKGDEALRLERWAEGTRILAQKGGRLLATGAETTRDPRTEMLTTGTRLLLQSVGRRQTFLLKSLPGNIASIEFQAPHLAGSPLPPAEAGKRPPLILTKRVQPGDFAWVLPFGLDAKDPRGIWVTDENKRSIDAAVMEIHSERGGPSVQAILAVQRERIHPAAISLVCLIGGLGLLGGIALTRRFPWRTHWVVVSLASCFWGLLTVRLLLAIRYALDPSTMDALAARGLSNAGIALTAVPGLLFLSVYVYQLVQRAQTRNLIERHEIRPALIHGAILLTGSVLAFQLPAWLWPSLPDRFHPVLFSASGAFPFVCAMVAFLILSSIYALTYSSGAAGITRVPGGLLCRARIHLENAIAQWGEVSGAPKSAMLLALVFVGAFMMLGGWLTSGNKVFTEFLVPILIVWPAALFFLGSLGRQPGFQLPWSSVLIRVFTGLLLPLLVLPVLIRDVGGIFATAALLGPLCILLIITRWNRIGLATIGFVVLVGSLATLLMVHPAFERLPLVRNLDFAPARILAWREGKMSVTHLLDASVGGKDEIGMKETALQNAIRHSWENQAMAHGGNYLGEGFGNAPVHLSQVPRATLQFDSVFSFYILSEFGLLGGMSLLWIYLLPLLLLLASASRHPDLGHAAALLVGAAMFFEATNQSLMNLGSLPFTGRNLPLLSVNSFTDLLLWSSLGLLALQASCWRVDFSFRGDEETFQDEHQWPSIASGNDSSAKHLRLFAYGFLYIVFPLLFFWKTAFRTNELIRDGGVEIFDLSPLMEQVKDMVRAGDLIPTSGGDRYRLAITGKDELSPYSRLHQEVVYFNSLSPDEQQEGYRLKLGTFIGGDTNLRELASHVDSLEGYARFMEALRDQDRGVRSGGRPSLFHVEKGENENLIVEPNPRFNQRSTMMDAHGNKDDIPRLSLEGGKSENPNPLLVGPAWQAGRWIPAYQPLLPWAHALSHATLGASKGLVFGNGDTRLTLDIGLQKKAQDFVTRQGLDLQSKILSEHSGGAHPLDSIRPQRVALTIIKLSNGEVTCLAGWPFANSAETWEKRDEYWIPPARWVEMSAPLRLRYAYEGDRNMEAMVPMGSSTKPLWATASLRVHPGLDSALRVRGDEESENAVFGWTIPGNPWHVRKSGMIGMAEFLSKSDNRYAVRVGFLGFASEEGKPVSWLPGGTSGQESLNGRMGIRPQFPPDIAFSEQQPAKMKSLDKTAMAKAFQDLYGVQISSAETKKYGNRLDSFWTADENDDRTPSPGLARFKSISPVVANLAFDAVDNPRMLVSMILGGGSNRWSNVQFAAAMATTVTGRPLVPHIVGGRTQITARKTFKVSPLIREGLRGVFRDSGTGAKAFLRILERFHRRGYELYGKTGTLAMEDYDETGHLIKVKAPRQLSRIALVIVQRDSLNREPKGLALSMFGERASKESGDSAKWMAEFLDQNFEDILALANR